MKKRSILIDYAAIIAGSLIMAFGIKNLYDPVGLVTGGFAGLSIIIKEIFGVPLWVTNTVLNIPLFLIAIPALGWNFIKRTLIATVSLSVGLAIIPEIRMVADDMVLSSLFGGVISGVGMGIVFVFQATTGGTDMLAALMHKKIKRWSLIEIMQVIDGLIVLLGISIFGIRQAMYALIAVFALSNVSDNIVEGLKFSKQAFIISDHSDRIADAVMNIMDRGVTAIDAKGMYTGNAKQMLFCVVAKKEISKLKELVKQIDPDAFVILSDAREVFGEGFIEK